MRTRIRGVGRRKGSEWYETRQQASRCLLLHFPYEAQHFFATGGSQMGLAGWDA